MAPDRVLVLTRSGKLRAQGKNGVITKTNQKQAAIVTGASSGMGLGITRALLEQGYGVVANSRRFEYDDKRSERDGDRFERDGNWF